MFSREIFVVQPELLDADRFLRDLWQEFSRRFALQALFVINYDIDKSEINIVTGYGVPIEPFNGSEKQWLIDVLSDCVKRFPKPHIHNIQQFALANIIKRYSQKLQGTNRVWFYPVLHSNIHYIVLGFPAHTDKNKNIPDEFQGALSSALFLQSSLQNAASSLERLRVMELFVKETGHDVAGSVQAILAKAQTISDGRVTGDAVKRKAIEIENEIINTHRVAEFLGTAVDPNYQLRNPDEYNIYESIATAVQHYSSEAEEKRITVNYNQADKSCWMWGDEAAIEQAIGQLLLNAIKYAFGQTYIEIVVSEYGDYIQLTLSNLGIALPSEPELRNIWDFGYRGKAAKERHVNGSGIGLYTVKKITVAHAGSVWAGKVSDKTTFRLTLPKPSRAKALLGRLL